MIQRSRFGFSVFIKSGDVRSTVDCKVTGVQCVGSGCSLIVPSHEEDVTLPVPSLINDLRLTVYVLRSYVKILNLSSTVSRLLQYKRVKRLLF